MQEKTEAPGPRTFGALPLLTHSTHSNQYSTHCQYSAKSSPFLRFRPTTSGRVEALFNQEIPRARQIISNCYRTPQHGVNPCFGNSCERVSRTFDIFYFASKTSFQTASSYFQHFLEHPINELAARLHMLVRTSRRVCICVNIRRTYQCTDLLETLVREFLLS